MKRKDGNTNRWGGEVLRWGYVCTDFVKVNTQWFNQIDYNAVATELGT